MFSYEERLQFNKDMNAMATQSLFPKEFGLYNEAETPMIEAITDGPDEFLFALVNDYWMFWIKSGDEIGKIAVFAP